MIQQGVNFLFTGSDFSGSDAWQIDIRRLFKFGFLGSVHKEIKITPPSPDTVTTLFHSVVFTTESFIVVLDV